MGNNPIYFLILIILIIVFVVGLIILLKNCLRLSEKNNMLRESIKDIGDLNDRLRMERHDYLNHLQIIYGLMELGEYEEMNSYLQKIYKEFLKTGKAIKTSKPAINALLAAKIAECDSKGIELIAEVKSDLKNIRIEDWELCKVISNLTDNAIRALESVDKNERIIRISISETKEDYCFEVEDNGPGIPWEAQDQVFKKGFTTKDGEGHGMGLYIVSCILAENKGRIGLESNEDKTVFTINLAKGE